MSSESTEIDEIEWENVARRIFYECLASTSSASSSISSFSSLSSTSSKVTVKTLLDYIRKNNASSSYRNNRLLDELQKSIEDVSWDGQVNYASFKKASRRWVASMKQRRMQDRNNNVPKDDSSSDFPVRSDDDKQNSVDSSDLDRDFGILGECCRKTKTPRKFITADFVDLLNVSSYSPSSDTTHGCAMSDTTPESADDADSGCGVTAGIGELSQADLRMRVRRFDEENALLREDLLRAEESAVGLQRQLENLRLKLDQTKDKCRQLERENDEHQELLHEADQKERDCRWALQKLEKEKNILARKLEDAEAEKQQITLLNSKLEKCKKEKYECIREATVCKRELEDKQRDCELLKDQIALLTEANKNLQESYDKTVQLLRDKIQNLKKSTYDLHAPDAGESSSDGISSTTPIGYLHSYTESIPYSDNRLQDSLYDELKASGFSTANESRVRDLENELSWYEEENHQAVTQINKFIEQLRHKPSASTVPELNLNNANDGKTSEMSLLLRKISELSETMNKIIRRPKVKEASSQLYADSTYTNEILSSQFGIRSFEEHLRFTGERTAHEATLSQETSSLQRDRDVFIEAFSMNSHLLGEYVEEVELASETGNFDKDSTNCKSSMPIGVGIQEQTIIEPIVEELDRIIKCTNKPDEESTVQSGPSKNPRHRCIYTSAVDCAAKSTRNLSDNSQHYLASTYIVSSGGDGLSRETMNDTATNIVNAPAEPTDSIPRTIFADYSHGFAVDSLAIKMQKCITLDSTKASENDAAILEESLESELLDTKSLTNESSPTLSKTSERPATPRRIDENIDHLVNGDITDLCRKPNANSPKRKISVFHRSFDIDKLDDETQTDIGCSNTYRLTERSMSTPSDQRENSLDDGPNHNPESTKCSVNNRKFLLNYREKGDESDSSENPSPTKSLDHRDDSTPPQSTNSRLTARPIILAPTRLKLPSLMEIPSYESIAKKTRLDEKQNRGLNDEATRTNEPSQIHEKLKLKVNDVSYSEDTRDLANEVEHWSEKIERGVTYRKSTFSRELNFSDYPLLSPVDSSNNTENQISQETPDSLSRNISLVNDESASCHLSPECQSPVDQVTSKLSFLKTYENHQDPLKSRGSSYGRVEETGCRYETRNESTTSAGSYGGVSGTDIRDGQVEKSNVSPAVALAMSSGEDSSDSECDPMAIRENDNVRRNVVNETRSISPTVLNFGDGALLGTSTPAPTNNNNNNYCNNNLRKTDEISNNCETKKSTAQKREKRERPYTIRRSLSEGGCARSEHRCHLTNRISSQEEFNKEENRPAVFPSLTDVRLQESGIAKLPNNDELRGNLPEAELERKYIALSVGLVTDRVTLPRRVALSIRQRDQSERNLASEVKKMQQDIQDLAPLCIDRESVERVERVRHQLEMINQCAHRVSCTAETLGAVHQENRLSRAILLADRYLLVLRSRCEKLAHDLSETKRILMENNIVIEEHNGELGDDMPRTRYRGVPITNRTMMARRRASIATIFRPLGNFQEVTKDGLRQRNSVSGRVTLRRPSLTAECQKWEVEKLDRTDSSSSIGELREIFEQAESRRSSREENNNVLRLHSSNLSIRECENSELEVWTNEREEPALEVPALVDGSCESKQRRTSLPDWINTNHAPWKTMLWCMIISFFFGFYVKHVVSSVNGCSGTHFKWWSIEEILRRYLPVNNDSQRPI